jgi:hypothetical protein
LYGSESGQKQSVNPLQNRVYGQREDTVEGQQYTSIVPSSMGGNSKQAGSKIPTMSERISSLQNLLSTMPRSPLTGQF